MRRQSKLLVLFSAAIFSTAALQDTPVVMPPCQDDCVVDPCTIQDCGPPPADPDTPVVMPLCEEDCVDPCTIQDCGPPPGGEPITDPDTPAPDPPNPDPIAPTEPPPPQ